MSDLPIAMSRLHHCNEQAALCNEQVADCNKQFGQFNEQIAKCNEQVAFLFDRHLVWSILFLLA